MIDFRVCRDRLFRFSYKLWFFAALMIKSDNKSAHRKRSTVLPPSKSPSSRYDTELEQY